MSVKKTQSTISHTTRKTISTSLQRDKSNSADNVDEHNSRIEDISEEDIETWSAAKLTEDLCRWHVGRDMRTIPEDWGDVVEHVDPVFYGDPKTAAMKVLGLT